MANWKVGDVGHLIGSDWVEPDVEWLVGREFEVLGPAPSGEIHGRYWHIDVPGHSHRVEAAESHMRPLPPPNEVTSWEGCVFKPRELVDV